MHKQGFVYILTNQYHSVLYTGVTSQIIQRLEQHKKGKGSVFTSLYRCRKLVYLERCDDTLTAICREKKIKKMLRRQKVTLIETSNPCWRDLSRDVWE